jgi:hypothetical protein
VADVGCGWPPIEFGIEWELDEPGSVAANAGIPRGSVVQILGVGVVAAELEAVGELSANVDDERVVETYALRDP